MRHAVRWIVVGAMGLALVGATGGTARADAPVVVYASSISDDLARIQVGVQSTEAVASVTAHVIDPATGTEVATATDFALADGTTTSGRWVTGSRLQLDHLGSYELDVDVTDDTGAITSQRQAGWLAYEEIGLITSFVADRTTVDAGHRSVVLSGRVEARHPGTLQTRPLAGVTVDVLLPWGYYLDPAPVTAADGTFATAPIEVTQAGSFDAQPSDFALTTVVFPSNASLDIAIDPTPTRVSITATPGAVDAGAQVTYTGRAETYRAGSWHPLADHAVSVYYGVDAIDGLVGLAQTDGDGRFSITDSPLRTLDAYAYVFSGDDPYLGESRASTHVVVYEPRSFSDISASRAPRGVLQVQGHMQFATYSPGFITVDIQWLAPGSTRWRTVAHVARGDWDGQGYAFAATLNGMGAGSLRAYYPGASEVWRPLTSDPIVVPPLRG